MLLRDFYIAENATCGATGAASVASTVGGSANPTAGALGIGFDPNGHWGIYEPNRKKKTKNVKSATLIKR